MSTLKMNCYHVCLKRWYELVKDDDLKELSEGNVVGQDEDCIALSNSEILSDKDKEEEEMIAQGKSKPLTNSVNQVTTSPGDRTNESTTALDRTETSGRETRRKRRWKKSVSSEDEDYVQKTARVRVCYRNRYNVCLIHRITHKQTI